MAAPRPSQPRQEGAALLAVVAILLLLATYAFLRQLNATNLAASRNQATAQALMEAKAALVGFAAGVAPLGSGVTAWSGKRPGELPCPDLNDDGVAEASCGNASGSTKQDYRLGRLPWKTLGLPDLRDGSGERLWYAVSSNFKNNTRATLLLNSDTPGGITLRDASGNLLADATAGNGAIAVVFAPGPPLPRYPALTLQQRGCTPGTDCDPATLACTSAPPFTATPKCDPANYLDATAIEDNSGFVDGGGDGFIAGDIAGADGTPQVNDRLLWITPQDLMPALEHRVAGEISHCLQEYAAANSGHYPWAAQVVPGSAAPNYADTANVRFGRVPDMPFAASCVSRGGTWDGSSQTCLPNSIGTSWGPTCTIQSIAGWWLNWKELAFYGVADNPKPAVGVPNPACGPLHGGTDCLLVAPGSTQNKQLVVLLAGRALAGQARTSNANKNDITNYLEGGNRTDGDDQYQASPWSLSFNDILSAFPLP